MLNASSILITGAAGSMGTALARAYAAPGIHLFLGDIEAEPLESLAARCRSLGARVWPTVVDVTNRADMAAWISQSDQIQPLDLIIALAGISRGTFSREETTEETRAVFAVNLDGMLNTVEPAIPLFRQRGRGQIALTSSLAGTRGFPVAPSYCATKAAIRVYGEALTIPAPARKYFRVGHQSRFYQILHDRCQSLSHALPGQRRTGCHENKK